MKLEIPVTVLVPNPGVWNWQSTLGTAALLQPVPSGRLKLHEKVLEEASSIRKTFSYEHVSMCHIKEATAQRTVVATEKGRWKKHGRKKRFKIK